MYVQYLPLLLLLLSSSSLCIITYVVLYCAYIRGRTRRGRPMCVSVSSTVSILNYYDCSLVRSLSLMQSQILIVRSTKQGHCSSSSSVLVCCCCCCCRNATTTTAAAMEGFCLFVNSSPAAPAAAAGCCRCRGQWEEEEEEAQREGANNGSRVTRTNTRAGCSRIEL